MESSDEYLDAVSHTVAGAISRGYAVEIAYQPPDDDLFLGLVFTPMWNILTGPGRDGLVNSCPGMEYTWGTALVSYVGVCSYPYCFHRLDEDPELTSEYVTEFWRLSTEDEASALVELFDAVSERVELP